MRRRCNAGMRWRRLRFDQCIRGRRWRRRSSGYAETRWWPRRGRRAEAWSNARGKRSCRGCAGLHGVRQRYARFRSSAGRSRRLRPHGNAARRPREHRHSGRSRQHKSLARRRGRRQHGEFARPRRQEESRHSRRRCEAGAAEYQDRLIDESQFVRRRRRHAEIEHGEIRRRIDRRAEHRQAPPCVPGVWAARIAPQIRPVSRRRIGGHTAAPGNLLAAHRDHVGDAPRIRTVRIEREELLVAGQCVEGDCRAIGIVRIAVIAHRPVANVGERHGVRRRRRIGGPLGHKEWCGKLRSVPRHLGALRELADPQANPRENIVKTQSPRADHLGERGRVGAVRSRLARRHRTRRRIECDRRVRRRVEQRQAARQRLPAARERALSRRIENNDLHAARHCRERLREI